MKLKNKLSIMIASLVTTFTTVAASPGHTGDNQSYGHMMWGDGSWMHGSSHMAGYNMWGLGWFGPLLGIAFWILVILGIIYLYEQVTDKNGGEQDE